MPPEWGLADRETPSPMLSLKSPTALATFAGRVMSRGEALGTPVGTRVIAQTPDGSNVFLAAIHDLDRSSGTIAIKCPSWPDEPEQWVPPSQIFSRSGAAPALLASIGDRLDDAFEGWGGFRFGLGDVVTVRCGEVARCTGMVVARAMRQFDPRDPLRDNTARPFVPTYLVRRLDLAADTFYTEDQLTSIQEAAKDPTELAAVVPALASSNVAVDDAIGREIVRAAAAHAEDVEPEPSVSAKAAAKKASAASAAKPEQRRRKKRRNSSIGADGKPVCRACAFGAHSAHTCGNRGKALNPSTLTRGSMSDRRQDSVPRSPSVRSFAAGDSDDDASVGGRARRSSYSRGTPTRSASSTPVPVGPVPSSPLVAVPPSPSLVDGLPALGRPRKRSLSDGSDTRSVFSADAIDQQELLPPAQQQQDGALAVGGGVGVPTWTPPPSASATASSPPAAASLVARRRKGPPRIRRRTEPAELLGLGAALPSPPPQATGLPMLKRLRVEAPRRLNGGAALITPPIDTCSKCGGEPLCARTGEKCVTCASLEDCAIRLWLAGQVTLCG